MDAIQNGRHQAPGRKAPVAQIDHGWMTFADFMAQDATVDYLCEGVVPAAQGGIISGRFKTLKTSIAIDLFMSMATGTLFLGKFAVPKPVPCALMTSESGAASIMAIAARIAAAKGIDYRDGPHLTTMRATMTHHRHLEAMERNIDRHGWRCVGIDPTYLAFAAVGEYASNVFRMGEALEPVTSLIQRTGCSIILLNHSTKGRAKDIGRYDPPDLAEISMSGFAEWMRFWLLLAPMREWDEASGQHWLWMRTGGSAGHAALSALDVCEGEHDARNRRTKWETVVKADARPEARQRQNGVKDAQQKAAKAAQEEADRATIISIMATMQDRAGTKTGIRERVSINPPRFNSAFAGMVKDQTILETTITKANNRTYEGWKLRDSAEQ